MVERLHARLMMACHRRAGGGDAADLVQETMLAVHRVMTTSGHTVCDLEGLAMRILRARQVDHLRRRWPVALVEADALPARRSSMASERPATMDLVPAQVRFRGRLQRAILASVLQGGTLQGLGEHVCVPLKELRRVARGMAEALVRSRPRESVC